MTKSEAYIEQAGLFYEKYGLPKMAGRILGYLIISKTDSNSFEEIKSALRASKGSISGNINLLIHQGMLAKHMITGDRKSYYSINYDSLNKLIEMKIKSVTEFKNMIAGGIALISKQNNPKYQNLKTLSMYYEFLEKEMPLLRDKWLNKLKEIQ